MPVTVTVAELCDKLELTPLNNVQEQVTLTTGEINRPGLPFTGYYSDFLPQRVQLIGKAEMNYLFGLPDSEMRERIERFMAFKPPCVVCARSMQPPDILLECATAQRVPVLQSSAITGDIGHNIYKFVEWKMAPRVLKHGVMLDVFGVGVLLTGDSGLGKSETALELIKAGHRLVADDVVEITRVSSTLLVGCAPKLTQYLVEVRGIGIVDVRYLYGVGAVINQKEIDMAVHLELWSEATEYERLGTGSRSTEILGVQVPCTLLPVSPGRNLAAVIEVAARNNRLKRLGYDAAQDFEAKLQESVTKDPRKAKEKWDV